MGPIVLTPSYIVVIKLSEYLHYLWDIILYYIIYISICAYVCQPVILRDWKWSTEKQWRNRTADGRRVTSTRITAQEDVDLGAERCPHEWNLSSSHRTAAIGFPFWNLRSRRLTAQLHELMIGGLCTGWHFCLFFMLRLRRFTDKQKKPLLYNDWSACVSVCSCVNVRTSTFLQCALILHCNHRLLVYQCAAYSLLLYYYYTHKIKYHRYDKIYITN